MLFRRTGQLRKEQDKKLVSQLEKLKHEWENKRSLVERSFDAPREFVTEAKLAEAKYFYLFKEAKERKVSLRGK
ncbi:YaaL family protein [Mesobacillus maritimus]|uniref:YaaL family protein n=1 Tax=Mesobacillus maritimus TaxID=1643336 RepID=UPI00203D71D7|nr:YaaL family protein [Mesobacillus maritimus]MCM3588903.1 YaaL family protein [Mesobacillus maritimus]MCM3672149.1 YaaL family protein [Mesobacillus maritimus]